MKIEIEKIDDKYIITSERDYIQSLKYQVYMSDSLTNLDIIKKFRNLDYYEEILATFIDLIDILNILDVFDQMHDSKYFRINNDLLRQEILKVKEVKRYLSLKKIKNRINGMERY